MHAVCVCVVLTAIVPLGLERMVNDSKTGNCNMKRVMVDGRPHLCLFATTNIPIAEELRFNYGDDNNRLYWRQKVWKMMHLCNDNTVHGYTSLYSVIVTGVNQQCLVYIQWQVFFYIYCV